MEIVTGEIRQLKTGKESINVFNYEWIISNFWIYYMKTGDALNSPDFETSIDGISRRHRLVFYPEGYDDNSKGHILFTIRENLAIKNVGISISDNKNILLRNNFWIMREPSNSVILRCNFAKRDLFVNSENGQHYKNKLKIVCEFTFNVTEECNAIHLDQSVVTFRQWANTYEQLINDDEFSDVVLIIGNKSLRAHKSILSLRSPVFAAMFKSEMKEKHDNKVEIMDIRYEVCLEMLRYIYARKVNDIGSIANELLAAADKYVLHDLKHMCANILSDNVNAENAAENLRIASLHGSEILKHKTIEFIVTKGADVVDKPEFRQLPSDVICDVLSASLKMIM